MTSITTSAQNAPHACPPLNYECVPIVVVVFTISSPTASAFIILLAFLLGGIVTAILELVTAIRNKKNNKNEEGQDNECTLASEMKDACFGCCSLPKRTPKAKDTTAAEKADDEKPEKMDNEKTDPTLA